MTGYILEIACFNLESAIIAEESGANRIELCENYEAGGISPSENLLKDVLHNTKIPVFAMVRPRAGDFCYASKEIELMKKQIHYFKKLNCAGFVFGVLTSDNKINFQVCGELINAADPVPCTFHRAFDEIADKDEALAGIINLGFKRILTSGGANTALEGGIEIARLTSLSKNKIIIVPGGGIRTSNIKEIAEVTKCSEFHSAAITNNSVIADANEIKLMRKFLNR